MKYMISVLLLFLVVIGIMTMSRKMPVPPTPKAAKPSASSVAPAAPDGKALYSAHCASCHGPDAKKAALGQSPVIAGQTAQALSAKLEGYRDGTYGGKMKRVMIDQVSKLSRAETEAIAEYVAKL
jgi:cytochrome c